MLIITYIMLTCNVQHHLKDKNNPWWLKLEDLFKTEIVPLNKKSRSEDGNCESITNKSDKLLRLKCPEYVHGINETIEYKRSHEI